MLIFVTIILNVVMTYVVPLIRTIRVRTSLFVTYVFLVLYITLLSRRDSAWGFNPMPFHFLYWVYRRYRVYGILGILQPIEGVLLNIFLFFPFGFLLSSIKKFKNGYVIVILALAFSFMIEILQLYLHIGLFETDDLITNSLGSWFGYSVFTNRNQGK